MEALIAYFKKHKALAWIGIGVLAVGAYIIGKNTITAPATTTDTTTPASTGTFNYNYYQQPALPPATTDTTGTTATPAATPTPTDTGTPQPVFMPSQPITFPSLGGSTTNHPAGITDHFSPAPHPASTYTIKAGDTLSTIAAKFGLNANQLYNANRGTLSQVSKQHGGYYYDTSGATKSPPSGLKLYPGTVLSTTP